MSHPDPPAGRSSLRLNLIVLGLALGLAAAFPGDGGLSDPGFQWFGVRTGGAGQSELEAVAGAVAWDPELLRRIEATSPSERASRERAFEGRAFPGRVSLGRPFAGRPGVAVEGLTGSGIPTPAETADGPGLLVPALLEFAGGPPALEALGFLVLGGRWSSRAVLAPKEAFDRLRARPDGLRSARLARPLSQSLDRSLPRLGISQVRSGGGPTWVGPTGRGVIVGIVDSGLDIHHPDFRKPDGTTRVLAFWDQTVSHTSPDVPIGSLLGPAALNRLLRDATPEGVRLDLNGHGTHVSGIAAGNGAAGGTGPPFQFVGVAPEADLIAVRSYLNEAAVVGGVQFVFDEAARLGRPAVVNLSLGHQFGPHDGSSVFERLLSELCGPGRLVVVAAGNDGARGIHASLPAGKGPDSVSFQVPSLPNPGDLVNVVGLEVWGPPGRTSRFTLVFPDGRRIGPFHPGKEYVLEGRDYVLNAAEVRYDFGRNFNLDLRLFSRQWPTGTFHLVAEPEGRGPRGGLQFWLPYYDLNGPKVPAFVQGRAESGTISEPANALNVISVAATVSRNCWLSAARSDSVCSEPAGTIGELVFYSSTGPTPDGRLKPEVSAPGEGIASALAAAMSTELAQSRNLPLRTLPDGRHWINSGTSMAAPHVTGALALLLEQVPALTPGVAQDRLRQSGGAIRSPAGTYVGPGLDLARFLRVAARVGAVSIAAIDGPRARITWDPLPAAGVPAIFRIARGTASHGPFDVVGRADAPDAADTPRVIEDGPLEPGRRYYYRLSVLDATGLDLPLDTLDVWIPGESRLALVGPRANPGLPPVVFRLFLPEAEGTAEWSLEIFDAQGRRVGEAARGSWGPESRDLEVAWEARTVGGGRVAGGVYLARLTAAGLRRAVKVVIRG